MNLLGYLLISISAFAFFTPQDEAMRAMDENTFSQGDYEILKTGAHEDYFGEMDKGITLPKNSMRTDGSPFPENQNDLVERLQPYLPELSKEELIKKVVMGRNNWLVYTGGNDRFWDSFNHFAFGGIDLLKTISNHPEASAPRSQRWEKLGLVNEPCFKEVQGPRPDRYGLWLDVRDENCSPADPFENAQNYPGVEIGSRGKDFYVGLGEIPPRIKARKRLRDKWIKRTAEQKNIEKTRHEVGSSYGYATGILGLRLFTNPEFDEVAAARWDPKKYYTDASYFNDPNLIKPYRVGMACAFCHVGPSPTNPPSDFNNPKWENLSSTVGSQYFWVDRVLFWNYKKSKNNFIHQLLHSQRPGTIDTSLVSSDQINNSRTMNAVYGLRDRLKAALDFGHTERLKGDERLNKKMFDQPMVSENSPLQSLSGDNALTDEFQSSRRYEYVTVPRILKDGADSASALGSLNRVYVNIGLYSEEWTKNFVPLLGDFNIPFFKITPFEIKKAEKNSAYWNANVEQTPNLALFLMAAGSPDKLKEAPQGNTLLSDYNSETVELGKEIFANKCASCHSSKLPDEAYAFFKKKTCIGEGYKDCWNSYWNFVNSSPDYHDDLLKIVKSEDFLEDNFLSTDLRVPMNVVQTQTCTAVATNGIEGDIWDNFSSDSYKSLPNVNEVSIYEPTLHGTAYAERKVSLPGGGRGYIRPPSLVSVWSTAPFFNNNTLGPFNYEGTLDKRIESFETSIDWLLNPEKRGRSKAYDEGEMLVEYEHNGHKAQGVVDVLQVDSYVSIPAAYIPSLIFDWLPNKWKVTYEKYQAPPSEDSEYVDYLLQSEANNNYVYAERSDYSNSYAGDDSADYIEDYNDTQERLFLGPIPKGVPINLISNMNLKSSKYALLEAILSLTKGIDRASHIEDEEEKLGAFMEAALEPLLTVSKCNDFIVNKGHFFGSEFEHNGAKALTEEEQFALKEFLKHF